MLLAGCATPEEVAPATIANNSTTVFAEDYALDTNTTIPKEELQNATLGAEHLHDLWGGATEIVLLDGEVTAGLCEGPADATFQLLQTAFEGNGAATGCARLGIPEGAVVPEGTGNLLIEVDATASLKAGSMALDWRNKAREEYGETTAEPVHAWNLNLTPDDWDLPHAKATSFIIYVSAKGPVGVLDGPMKARVVAQKIPGWEPILAVAHVDHWKLPALHDFPAPGVMKLFDGELSVTNIDPARFMGQNLPESAPLTDLVAPGATTLTLVVDALGHDCAPVLDCWLVPSLVVGGYERERFGEEILHEGARRVYSFTVPDEVPEDSVYATESTTRIAPRINACLVAAGDASCGFASLASTTARARVLALAWKDPVDLALLKTVADTPPA